MKERYWKVNCLSCETTLDLPVSDFTITSTDQGAEFIKKPTFVCGKCDKECYVRLTKKGKL